MVRSCIGASELLATLVANKRLGGLTLSHWSDRRSLSHLLVIVASLGGSLCLELLERLILGFLQPGQSPLHCGPLRSGQRTGVRHTNNLDDKITSSGELDGQLGTISVKAHLEQEFKICLSHFGGGEVRSRPV